MVTDNSTIYFSKIPVNRNVTRANLLDFNNWTATKFAAHEIRRA